jgi:stringent starvation protein B
MSEQKNSATHVRRAMLQAAIDTIETLPDFSKLHINVVVFGEPDNPDSLPLWNAPLNEVNEHGFITLNISQQATGIRHFADDYLEVATRFKGVDHHLYIPYGLIVGISSINHQGGIMTGDSLSGFISQPTAPDETEKTEKEEAPVSTTEGNVVTASFGKRKSH